MVGDKFTRIHTPNLECLLPLIDNTVEFAIPTHGMVAEEKAT